jgi:hypothetical protein
MYMFLFGAMVFWGLSNVIYFMAQIYFRIRVGHWDNGKD